MIDRVYQFTDKHFGKIAIGLVLLGVVTVFAITVAINSFTCAQRWIDSGTESRFKITTGCQVQRANGTWVSEFIIRDVDL